MHRTAPHRTRLVSMLFGLMLMPRPVVPDLQPIEISEGAPDVSFFGRGNPDLCRNEYWLRYEPFRAWNTLTCRQPVTGDEDGDGLWDMAEKELLWAFLPYLVFDNDEEHLRKLVLVFQATPYSPLESRMPATTIGEVAYIRIKLVFLFEADTSSCSYVFAEHGGDSESISLFLEGRRDPQTGEMRLWRLLSATGYKKGSLEDLDSKYLAHCNALLNPGPYSQQVLDYTYLSFYFNPTLNPTQGAARVDSGLLHPKVFVSKNKHGLYPSHSRCIHADHGGCDEECSGGEAFLFPPGIQLEELGEPEASFLTDMQSIQSGSEPPGFILQGNLGEKSRLLFDDLGESGTGWFRFERVTKSCFCGGKRLLDMTDNCGEFCTCGDELDVECGAGVWKKMMDMSNWVSACIPDADQDGVPTTWDCDDQNPFLAIDADRDHIPDEPSLNGEACRETCQSKSDESSRKKCLHQCGMRDNCVMSGTACSRYLMQPYVSPFVQTQVYRDCVTVFENPWMYLPSPVSDDGCAPQNAGIYIQPPGSCAPEPWGVTYADIREKQVLTLKNTETEHGFYKCTVPVLETGLALRGGGYRHVMPGIPGQGIELFDTRGMTVDVPEVRPLSWMVCGCQEGDTDCENTFCAPASDIADPFIGGWVPFQLTPTDPLAGQSFGQVLNQGLNFRHKPIDVPPQPIRKTIENRLEAFPRLAGKVVRTRISYPLVSSSFNGRWNLLLGENDFAVSNTLDPVKTSMVERCRKTQKSDFFFDLGEYSEVEDDFINSMQVEHVIAGHPLGNTKAWMVHAVPEGTTAKVALSEVTGPGFTPEFPQGLFVDASQVTDSSLKSARGIGLNKACCAQKALDLMQPSLVLVSDDWQEPLLIFSTAQGYRGTFWSSWAKEDVQLPVLNRTYIFEVDGNPQVIGRLDGQWRIVQLNLEPRTSSVRPLFESSPTAVPFLDSNSGQASFWEGEMQQVTLTDAAGGVITVILETPVRAGSQPRVFEGAFSGQVIIINPDEGLLYQVELPSGRVRSSSLPEGIIVENTRFGFDALGGRLWAVAPDEDGQNWTWDFLEPTFDGSWKHASHSHAFVVTPESPLYPEIGLNPPVPQTGSPKKDGCGCMVGARRSSGSLALFLTMLGVIFVMRRRRNHWPVVLIVLVSLTVAACDDSHKKIPHDGGPDGDVTDVPDDADIDGEIVDCSGRQTCITWVPAQVIPNDQLVPLDDSVCEFLPQYPGGTRVGSGHLFPVECREQVGQDKYYQIYLVNIDTLDATRITDVQTAVEGTSYLVPRLNRKTLAASVCISGNSSCGKAVYDFGTSNWEIIHATLTGGPNTVAGNGYVIFQQNPSEGALPELMLYDLMTRQTERLVAGHDRPAVFWADDDLVVWGQYNSDQSATLMKILDRDTDLVTTYPEVTELEMGFPYILYVEKHQVIATLLSAPCASDYTEWNLDLWRLDVDTQDWKPIANDPVWQQGLAYIQWPLVVYLDYGVACTGNYVDEYDYSRMRAYMVIHNLETDVRRPIPLPFDFYRPIALSDNWKLIFRKYDSVRVREPAYILDLVAAGLVDDLGNVIPDPTFPPVAGN